MPECSHAAPRARLPVSGLASAVVSSLRLVIQKECCCSGMHANHQYCLFPDPDAEVCLHVLRLIQSVVLEPEVFSKSASELQSSLPLQPILVLPKSHNPQLQTATQDLLEDLHALENNV